MSKLEVDKIDPQSGTDLELGTSGDTITIPALSQSEFTAHVVHLFQTDLTHLRYN